MTNSGSFVIDDEMSLIVKGTLHNSGSIYSMLAGSGGTDHQTLLRVASRGVTLDEAAAAHPDAGRRHRPECSIVGVNADQTTLHNVNSKITGERDHRREVGLNGDGANYQLTPIQPRWPGLVDANVLRPRDKAAIPGSTIAAR